MDSVETFDTKYFKCYGQLYDKVDRSKKVDTDYTKFLDFFFQLFLLTLFSFPRYTAFFVCFFIYDLVSFNYMFKDSTLHLLLYPI